MPEISKLALNAGELSDELAGRIDLNKFNTGCEVLENARVLRAGGVTRRAGLKYVGGTLNNNKARLVGFEFSDAQGYILEFTVGKMRVIQGDTIGATYDTPWSEAQIFDLQFAQRVDRIIVTHPTSPVQNIVKYEDGTWAVVEHPWQERVWELFPTTDEITMTADATTAVGTSVTVTASADIFGAVTGTGGDWVGDRLKLEHVVSESSNEYDSTVVTTGRTAFNHLTGSPYAVDDIVYESVSGDLVHYTCTAIYTSGDSDGSTSPSAYPSFFSAGVILVPETTVEKGWVFETFGTWEGVLNVERSYDGGTTWTTIKTIRSTNNRNERLVETETQTALIRVNIIEFGAAGNLLRTEFTNNSYVSNGVGLITSVTSPTEVVVTVEKEFFSTDTAAIWYECAFSPRNGYPTGVTFYQGRLCFGGTTRRPQSLWLSQTQKPFDFGFGTLATDGMSFTTDAEGYEAITWLSSHLNLLVGTTLGVWAISSPDGSVLTPESNRIDRQMRLGAQSGFQAAPIQSNVLFLQHNGRKIQELTGGSVEYGGYLSADLTQLATHVTRNGVTQIAVGEHPDSTLFLVNGGEISVLTYERSQNVVGWSRWKTEGDFESFTTTNGAGEDDDHYAVVNRGGNRYIEYLTPDMLRIEEDNDVANLRFLDCYTEEIDLTPDPEDPSILQVTGLDRFQGLEVDTFIDGEPHGTVTVGAGIEGTPATGAAILPRAGNNVVIGLPYTTEVRPMSIDFGAIASKSAIIEVLIRFRNSLGGEVSQDRENWSKVAQTQPRITDDVPLSLLSQDFQSSPHSTWARKPSISVRQTQPLPMTILAMRLKTKSSK
tara:strand:+ start:2167 stop:4647 length:2481 start_codon:yes stop_codon:yes gene_type:complete